MTKYLLAILIAMLALGVGYFPAQASYLPTAATCLTSDEIYTCDVSPSGDDASKVGGYSMAYHATASPESSYMAPAPVPTMHSAMPALRPSSAGTVAPFRWQHGFTANGLNAACNSYNAMARAIHRQVTTGAHKTITYLTT